ncbi:MAG: alpha/beta fold hydrolase [Acidimicrobiia bacterium]
MTTSGPTYDELALVREAAHEWGLPAERAGSVRRVEVPVSEGRVVSGLLWGEGPPEVVLLHGGSLNAHTWDVVAMALDRPALALDLPGHGWSSWRDDRDYNARVIAPDVALAVAALAPSARGVVGMSLGGLTSLPLARAHPELVRRVLLVDITPGAARPSNAHPPPPGIGNPQVFESFDQLLDITVRGAGDRAPASLRRGLLHNARRRPDGRWVWRHHRGNGAPTGTVEANVVLWEDLASLDVPVRLVWGDRSRIVHQAEVDELAARVPSVEVVCIPGASHSIQGSQPLLLADQIRDFLALPG